MREKFYIRNLGKTGYDIVQTIPFPDSSGMKRDIELESPGPREGGGVTSRSVVLFEDKSLEALPREGRCAALTTETGTDDDRIELIVFER
jgi:hypothetical protein